MQSQRADHTLPKIRFIVACPRSGSTLLMRIFAEAPTCAVTSRLVLMGKHDTSKTFEPDYTIMDNPWEHGIVQATLASGKSFLINKEELGNDTRKGECDYNIFPNSSTYDLVKPVFLIRDPIRTFDSWKHVGWQDIKSLIDCYSNLFRMLSISNPSQACCLLYERLVNSPYTEIERICSWWGVPYSDEMLHFKQQFGSFLFNSEHERKIYCEEKPLGLFATVGAYSTVVPNVPYHNLLSNDEKDYIERKLGRMYVDCWRGKVEKIRAILKGKTWFGFDLDDTLHEFRKASTAAVGATLQIITQKYGTPIEDLKRAYAEVLSQKTSNAFADGKSSNEYRKERFSTVLNYFSLPLSDELLEELLRIYDLTLTNSLELKRGALSLLMLIKSIGKKIAVITEGPQDAQERTLEALGLMDKIDFLATTNFFLVSKTAGLFKEVLKHLKIGAADMVYVGDSEQRDILPAMNQGIYTVHYAEHEHFSLDIYPAKINTLEKLEYILLGP